MTFALAHPSRQRRYILPFARDRRVGGVVFRHVACAAAAGGVGQGFDGRRHEVWCGRFGGLAADVSWGVGVSGFKVIGGRRERKEGGGQGAGEVSTGAAAAVGDAA